MKILHSGFFLFLVLLSGMLASCQGPDPLDTHASWMSEPSADYRQGLDSQDKEPEKARELFARAAAAWEALGENHGDAWYDAAVAWYLADRPDRSIIAARHYLAANPFSLAARDNLAEARKAASTLPPGGEGPLDWPWFLWLSVLSAWLGAGAVLSWGIWMIRREKTLSRVSMVLVILAVLVFALGAADRMLGPRTGVILEEVQGRMGDGAMYQAQPAKAWKAGQEGLILETRDTWVRIEAGGSRSWVPRESILILEN